MRSSIIGIRHWGDVLECVRMGSGRIGGVRCGCVRCVRWSVINVIAMLVVLVVFRDTFYIRNLVLNSVHLDTLLILYQEDVNSARHLV